MSNLIKNNIDSIYKEIILAINNSKNKVASAINSEMIILYWTIGKIIKIEILKDEKAEYMTQLHPKELLQGKLHAAIERAKEIFELKEIE